MPSSPGAAWIAFRLEQGRKAATLVRGVAALSCAHELAGFESFSRSRIVQDALRGMRRILGTAPTRKAPVTVALMSHMMAVQPDTLIGDNIFWSVDRHALAMSHDSSVGSKWYPY